MFSERKTSLFARRREIISCGCSVYVEAYEIPAGYTQKSEKDSSPFFSNSRTFDAFVSAPALFCELIRESDAG